MLELLRVEGFHNLQAFDVCSTFAQLLKERGFTVSFGASALDYLKMLPADSLDAILLVDVLEHLPLEDGLAFLRECRRVIEPRGRIVIQTPNASGLFVMSTFVADPTHATPWNELRLISALRGSGFVKVDCQAMRLPSSFGNLIRESVRAVLFVVVRFVTRLCGATPVRVLTHNIVCEAR